MADPNRLAGVAFVTIDGKSAHIAGQGNYTVSGSTREALNGQDGYHGYSETPRPGKISWQGRDSGALSISDLNEAADVTVVLQLANGKVVVGRNMTRIGENLAVNTEDATFEVDFIGPDVKET